MSRIVNPMLPFSASELEPDRLEQLDRGLFETLDAPAVVRAKQERLVMAVKLFHLPSKHLNGVRDDDVPREPLAGPLAALRRLGRHAHAHHHASSSLDLEHSGCLDTFVRDD